MNYCRSLFLLITPALIGIVLLGVAFSTHWWTIPLEKNIPQENSLNSSSNTRIYSTLIPIPISRGLLSECIGYRNAKILVSNSFDFREENSDKNQLNGNCSNNQFMCQTGVAISRPLTHCIDRREQCNHIIHCEDKSDELSCNNNFQIPDCPNGYTKCLDGKTCYRKDEQTCDGVSNCMDNSDEKDCNEEKCRQTKHVYCPREERCARRDNSYRCDGIVDCEDSSDEENCQQCNGEKDTFLCDSKCFLPKYRCDGSVHCSDFRDEINCTDHSGASNSSSTVYHMDRLCAERRFNPFHISPPKFDSLLLNAYPHHDQRAEYVSLIYNLRLMVFYGITGGLIFIFFSIISLFFLVCCRHKCVNVPYYFYSLWTLFAWLFICIALVSFVIIWIWKKQVILDYERNFSFDIMIHQVNPSLQNLEFFGLSFWLACGAALAVFIGLLLSCCVCCTVSSSRSENKEYEIMHMQNY